MCMCVCVCVCVCGVGLCVCGCVCVCGWVCVCAFELIISNVFTLLTTRWKFITWPSFATCCCPIVLASLMPHIERIALGTLRYMKTIRPSQNAAKLFRPICDLPASLGRSIKGIHNPRLLYTNTFVHIYLPLALSQGKLSLVSFEHRARLPLKSESKYIFLVSFENRARLPLKPESK